MRTLGFTLRTIPKLQIVSYAMESWSLPRGYGIRGIGNTRAYVWGNKVVHIRTTDGEVYSSADAAESWTLIGQGLTPISKSGHYRIVTDPPHTSVPA